MDNETMEICEKVDGFRVTLQHYILQYGILKHANDFKGVGGGILFPPY